MSVTNENTSGGDASQNDNLIDQSHQNANANTNSKGSFVELILDLPFQKILHLPFQKINNNIMNYMKGTNNLRVASNERDTFQPISDQGEDVPLSAMSQRKQSRSNKFYPKILRKKQENPASNMFYRRHMGIFLILLSLSPLVLSVFARFGPEDQKPEYLVGLLILLCFLLLLQFLLFVSMILCPKGNKRAIAVLFVAGVYIMIGLILASIAKYRMDNDEEEEAITEPAIGLSCVTLILLAVFVGIFNIK